jgi:NTE family protein
VNNAVASLLEKLPEELKESDEAKFLSSIAHHRVHNIVHIIYRPKSYDRESKDYEFSRQSMEERWRDGYYDTVHTLRHPEVLERPAGGLGGVATFDLARRD